jgi:ABC transporter substrate binding protein (PQQ-dependent alcohol dehydrogenase system)
MVIAFGRGGSKMMSFGRRGLNFVMVLILGLFAGASVPSPAPAADPLSVRITWIGQDEGTALPPLSLVEPRELPDEGLAGASLGIADNQTTGGFLGQNYELNEVMVPADGDPVAAARDALAAGEKLIVTDLPAEHLQRIADLPEAEGALIFNARAEDDVLRTEDCQANVFHTIPSRAMKADALAQYLVWKRWNRWFLIHGERPADLAFADALRRAAQKFNGEIVEEREYAYNPTSRVTDSGHVQVQRQIPVFTQDAPEHDVVLVADESDVFGEYLPYHTWDPRPVVGTQGLVPTAWSRAHEQWGGTQMQNRFETHAGRWMRERDYTSWLAVRTIGEAVTRTGKAEPTAIRDYLRSDQFEIGAFKGEALTFRPWNQQMRQPVLLASPRMLVSVSPQEQFLHQRTHLDSLGFDQPETSCDLQ